MACVVGFLLKTFVESSPVNQLIFIASNPQESIYKIYDPRGVEFPIINGDIQQTKVEVKNLGTYISVYCSKTMTSQGILNKISGRMVDLRLNPHHGLLASFEETDRCSEKLDEMYVEGSSKSCLLRCNSSISWSKIDSTICPPDMIVQMALKCDISVVGKYKSFAPTESKHGILVKADKRFRLRQFVNDETLFIGNYWTTDSVAMAWYQGHLQLFHWKMSRGWFPLTQIGKEHDNAAMLYYYVLGNNHEIWNSGRHLSTEINNILKSTLWAEYEQRIIDLVVSGSTEIPHNIREDKGKLQPIIHDGHIGAD